jgi:hypothetical protein
LDTAWGTGTLATKITGVDAQLQQRTWKEFQNLLDICRLIYGPHIEDLLGNTMHTPSYFIVVN